MNTLLVKVNDVEIGLLELFEEYRQQFTFLESYINALVSDRPVLGQIFEDRFPQPILVDGPICWFNHLLPQGVMRKWRCEVFGIEIDDNFELLHRLGSDLPGAVLLEPAESRFRKRSRDHGSIDAFSDSNDNLLKFSLAGAQWKLSAKSSGRGLTTNATDSGVSVIAKFHAPEYPGLPQCEFATMNWAKKAGITISNFELRNANEFDSIPPDLPIGDGDVFVIERFDRNSEKRIHMEDFGQIFDRPAGIGQFQGSYEEIVNVIKWIAPKSTVEFLKLLTFNLICGNGDAHLKNFSILYDDNMRDAKLSPAYDIVSTILYYTPKREKLALYLGETKQFSEISIQSFRNLVDLSGLPAAAGTAVILETTRAILNAWNRSDVQENFSREQINRINEHMATIPLVAEI